MLIFGQSLVESSACSALWPRASSGQGSQPELLGAGKSLYLTVVIVRITVWKPLELDDRVSIEEYAAYPYRRNQILMIVSNPNSPTFKYDKFPLEWQMTRCEKFAFQGLVEMIRPETAIEIGTYKGGSLQVLSKYSKSVYSIDISPDCRETLGDRFDNVDFLTGESRNVLPPLLDQISESGKNLEFVLIDGEHTAEGVCADINRVLAYIPTKPLYIVFHDSFNPACREGILQADWAGCSYVHFVEVDFIPGVYHLAAFDHAEARSMYGGLAVALMLPNPREHDLVIHQSQKGLFDIVLSQSCHSRTPAGMISNFSRKLFRKIFR
jgi:hypothetical protein